MQFLAVLRHLEGFLEKSEERRPPLKLKNNGGLLSAIFLDVIENFQKTLFGIVIQFGLNFLVAP